MDFLDLIHTLFDIQDKFPDMTWTTEDGILKIQFSISDENEKLLGQGRQMFSDR